MAATRVACPRCKTVLSSMQALPAGRLLQCAKCATRFRVPQAKSAPTAQAKPAPSQAAQAAPATPGQANGKAAGARIVCPSCRAVMRLPAAVRAGRPIRCAKCATVFRLGRPQSMLARQATSAPKRPAQPTQVRPGGPARPTQLAGKPSPPPRPPKKTQLAGPAAEEKRPSTLLICAGCNARTRIHGIVPPGLAIPCPRCQRRLTVPGPKKTMLAPAKPATMIVPPAKKTQLAPAAKSKTTKLAPAAPARLACPACQAVLRFPAPVPAGRAIKCPRCARLFRLQPKGKRQAPPKTLKSMPRPATAAKPAAVAKPAAAVTKARRRPRKSRRVIRYAALAAILLLAAFAALWTGKSIWSYDIPDSEWTEFAPPGGGCRVLLPGEPETVEESEHDRGYRVVREVQTRGWTGIPTGEFKKGFFLQWRDRPAGSESLASLYASQRDEVIARIRGQLVSEQDLARPGLAGKEFVIAPSQEEEGLMIGRFFLVKQPGQDRSYLLLVAGPHLYPGQGDAARFLDSFRLK